MQNGNQKQNDVIFLTEQFEGLDLSTTEGYKDALTSHVYKCEQDGCDVEGTADTTVNAHARDGRKFKAPLFYTFQMKVEKQVTDRRTGNPIIDRDTGVVVTRQVVVLRQILCKKHAEIAEPAAKKAGFFVQVYPLPANLDFLRRMGQERVQRDNVRDLFVAMAKGQKTLADGIKASLILSLPPEGEEIKADDNGELPNILAIKGQLVGLVAPSDVRSYMAARKSNQELFDSAGFYLYQTPTLAMAKERADEHARKVADWKARDAVRKAEEEARAAARAEAEAQSQNIFANMAKQLGLKAPAATTAPKGGDRRKKDRDRRDSGPKPTKPEVTPEAATQIAEELMAAAPDTTEVPAPEEIEVEAPRGSQPPTLSAPIGMIAATRNKQ